jgi:WD40 repeat protein
VGDGALLTLGDPRMRANGYGSMTINAERSRIAITDEGALRVWNLPAKTLAFAVPFGGSAPQFVGDYLGVSPMTGGATRWWSSTGHEVPAPYPECASPLVSSSTPPAVTKPTVAACAAVSPLRVRVFGVGTQTLALEGLTADETSIDAIAVSPDGTWLAASTGYRVHVFALATGRRVWVRELRARYCVAFDRSNQLLVGHNGLDDDRGDGNEHTTLVLVNATDGVELARRRLRGYIEHCDLSPAGDVMLSVDPSANTTRVFALPTLEPVETLPGALPQRNAAFSADGQSIYAQNRDHVVAWEREARRWAPTVGHLGETSAMALSPDGDLVATVGTDGKLVLWALDGSPPRTLRDGLDFGLTAVAFSLDGTLIAIGSVAGSYPDLAGPPNGRSVVEVWDVASGKRIFRVARSANDIARLGFARHRSLFVLDTGSELAELDVKTGAVRSKRGSPARSSTPCSTPMRRR